MEIKGKCWNCGTEILPLEFGRRDSCGHCGGDTRVCKNCKHYDVRYHNECRETQADRVVEKEKANFCDYFTPGSSGGTNLKNEARTAAEALFKKK